MCHSVMCLICFSSRCKLLSTDISSLSGPVAWWLNLLTTLLLLSTEFQLYLWPPSISIMLSPYTSPIVTWPSNVRRKIWSDSRHWRSHYAWVSINKNNWPPSKQLHFFKTHGHCRLLNKYNLWQLHDRSMHLHLYTYTQAAFPSVGYDICQLIDL